MNDFKVRDLVYVKQDAPEEYLSGTNYLFTELLSEVLAVQDGKLVLGLADRTLTIPAEYCSHKVNEKRIERFSTKLRTLLRMYGAKMFAERRQIVVTFDEGETFYPIEPNYD